MAHYLGRKLRQKLSRYIRRKYRVNTTIKNTATLPRVIVNRSNRYLFSQVVDSNGTVLATVRDKKVPGSTKAQRAHNAGKKLGTILKKSGIGAVVFDRNGYLYHGRVRAFVQGLRSEGILV